MSIHTPAKHNLPHYLEGLRFILFIACYVLFDYGYFKIPIDTFINIIYFHGVVTVCADAINFITPLEQVFATGNHLLSSAADLEIIRGCDGAGVFFLLFSAILVFPAKFRTKLTGLVLGCILIYGCNLIRIIGLYFVVAHNPSLFSLVHSYIAPTLMVLVACGYFAYWAFAVNIKEYAAH